MQICALEEGDTWMTPYRRYIADGILRAKPGEGKMIKKNSERYTLVDGVLFRHGFTHPILTCVSGDECTRIMLELHEGICGCHVGGRSLASKVIRIGFYWPSVREDCVRYTQGCKQCQMHADWHKAPPEELRSIHGPWPFHTWRIDILGPWCLDTPWTIRRCCNRPLHGRGHQSATLSQVFSHTKDDTNSRSAGLSSSVGHPVQEKISPPSPSSAGEGIERQ